MHYMAKLYIQRTVGTPQDWPRRTARTQGRDISTAPWKSVPGKGVHCVVGSGVHEVSQQLVAMPV